MLDAMPRTLVAWFFLAPHQFAGIRISVDLRHEVVMRERIELLDTNDRHILNPLGAPRREQVVIYLAATRDDAPHLPVIQRIDFGDHRLEFSLGEFAKR